jgi:hypothetical protein
MRPIQLTELRKLMLLIKGRLVLLIFGISVFIGVVSSHVIIMNDIVNVSFMAYQQNNTDLTKTIIHDGLNISKAIGNLQKTWTACVSSLIEEARSGISINNSTLPTTTFLLKPTYQNKQSLTEGNMC